MWKGTGKRRWTTEAKLLATKLGLIGETIIKFVAEELRDRHQEERNKKKEKKVSTGGRETKEIQLEEDVRQEKTSIRRRKQSRKMSF